MDALRLALLRAEIQRQAAEIDKIYMKIEERKQGHDPASLESLGYQLHNLYCAFEDLLKIVAAFFENQVADESRYHAELLRRMSLVVEGVRPAFISEKTYRLLDNLRSFRHFFRHAYAYELDERKLGIVLEDALRLKELYPQDIRSFLEALVS